MSLEWLVNPISQERFLDEYWCKKPVHISRQDPDYFSSIFKLADLDELLGFSHTNKNVRMAWQGHQKSQVIIEGRSKTSICNFYDYYCEGQTIVVQNVHLRWEAIGKIANALSRQIGLRIGTHLYATPEASQGFGIHWDDHDIFALQLQGEKEWCLYDSGPVLPRKSTSHREFLKQIIEDPGEPSHQVLLKAGDLLYFPRGVTHRARANKEASLHLTFGVYSVTWEDALVRALKLENNRNLHKPLMPGFLNQDLPVAALEEQLAPMVQRLIENLDMEAVRSQLAIDVIQTIEPLGDGHFQQLANTQVITPHTKVTKRSGMVAMLEKAADEVRIVFPGNCHSVRSELADCLSFVAENETFQVADLPGGSASQEIVKVLIGKGLLKVESAPELV